MVHIERGQTLICEMSGMVTNCVTDPLKCFVSSLCKVSENREGISMSLLKLYLFIGDFCLIRTIE